MNLRAVSSIYRFEMARMRRTIVQSIVAPVLSTSLYFVIFGAAIGSRITEIDGVSYGSFIVPGLIMLAVLGLDWLVKRVTGARLRQTIVIILAIFLLIAPLIVVELEGLTYVGAHLRGGGRGERDHGGVDDVAKLA